MKYLGKLCILVFSVACLSAFGPCDRAVDKNGNKLVIVNVLDKEYYDRCRIKGSIQVSLEDLEQYAQNNWDKTTHIVVYCGNYMCTASGDGARMLKNAGFGNVWAYEAGAAEMKNQYPEYIEGTCTDEYLAQYQKPEGYQKTEDIQVISTDDLIKKIKEFKLL